MIRNVLPVEIRCARATCTIGKLQVHLERSSYAQCSRSRSKTGARVSLASLRTTSISSAEVGERSPERSMRTKSSTSKSSETRILVVCGFGLRLRLRARLGGRKVADALRTAVKCYATTQLHMPRVQRFHKPRVPKPSRLTFVSAGMYAALPIVERRLSSSLCPMEYRDQI